MPCKHIPSISPSGPLTAASPCSLRLHPLLSIHTPLLCSVTRRPILFVEPYWINKILDGGKCIEIRPTRIRKHVGKRIRLAAIGRREIWGSVDLVGCSDEPLTAEGWEDLREYHQVPGPLHYGPITFAWYLNDPMRCTPYAFKPLKGAQTFQLEG
jgi:hypothetical protein